MISKEIQMTNTGKSSFARLVEYITDSQDNELRIKGIQISNCTAENLKDAVQEVIRDQQLNKRSSKDKTLHILLSFQAQDLDILSEETRNKIEDEFCRKIGFGDHQRISVFHGDTDNPHIHLAINKIDRHTHKMNNPRGLWKTMAQAAREIETKYGISLVNHDFKQTQSESRVKDAESMSGLESLCSHIRQIDALKNAGSWKEFLQICRDNRIVLKKHGNGIIFTDHSGSISVKASTVDRGFSRTGLEKKFGSPFPDELAASIFADIGAEQPPVNQKEHEPRHLIHVTDDRGGQHADLGYDRKTPRLRSCQQEPLYKEFREENGRMNYREQLEVHRQETRERLQHLHRQREREYQAIRSSRLSGACKRKLYEKLRKQIARERETAILAERFATRKIKARSTWKGFLHAKALEGSHEAAVLLEQQQRRTDENRRLRLLEERLAGLGECVHVTKGGARIYRTSSHYIRIAGRKVFVQGLNSTNRQKISWKQGFTGISLESLIRQDRELSAMLQQEQSRTECARQEQERRERELQIAAMVCRRHQEQAMAQQENNRHSRQTQQQSDRYQAVRRHR